MKRIVSLFVMIAFVLSLTALAFAAPGPKPGSKHPVQAQTSGSHKTLPKATTTHKRHSHRRTTRHRVTRHRRHKVSASAQSAHKSIKHHVRTRRHVSGHKVTTSSVKHTGSTSTTIKPKSTH